MFNKQIPFKVESYEIVEAPNQEAFEKVARVIDFPSHVTYDPDNIYLWIRIVSSGEHYGPNKNGDYFPLQELLSYYETFRDGHPFKNHENKQVEKAIGRIYDVRFNDEMKTVEVFKSIDKKVAPEIVRGYQKGYLTDVSMGCKVPYTVCSVCGNKAKRQSEFCTHVKNHRLAYLPTGERVYEINYQPRFHDSSVVLTGAERVAKAIMIIDEPPAGVEPSFKKVASADGVSRFIPLTEKEMEKVAAFKEKNHPLLRPPTQEKTASVSDIMSKIAELEKEITGKIVGMQVDDTLSKTDRVQDVGRIIRFLTDERFDAESLESIAKTIRSLASQDGLPVEKVFATFLGVAELLGITLYPQELHTIIRHTTDAHMLDATESSKTDKTEAFPSDATRALDEVEEATRLLPQFDDPSRLFRLYDNAAFAPDRFARSVPDFIDSLPQSDTLSSEAPRHVIEVLHNMLRPVLPQRSLLPEHLVPRVSIIISGRRPLIGGPDVARDISMLANPRTMGDLMGAISYKTYESMRPQLRITRLVKMADEQISALEKQASIEDRYAQVKRQAQGFKEHVPRKLVSEGGVGRLKLLAGALPLAYGASAFFNSKDSNGQPLSSGERFIAEHPAMLGIGAAIAGKPLTGLVGKGINAADNGARALGTATHNKLNDVRLYAMKEATDYNVFGEDVLDKIAAEFGCGIEKVRLLKLATLFELGEMEKEAQDLRGAYGIDDASIDLFLDRIAREVDSEMEKAAGDFANNMLIDAVADTTPLSTSIPGRLVDAFVMKKLMNIGKPKEGEDHEVAGKTPAIEPQSPHVPDRPAR